MTESQTETVESMALAEALKALHMMDAAGIDTLMEAAGRAKKKRIDAGRAAAIEQIKAIAASVGMDPAALVGASYPSERKKMAPVPVKYRDEATGNTWTGRGRMPGWLVAAGQDIEKFAV